MPTYRTIVCLSLLSLSMCGCANMWHELQPHRVRRINPSWDPEFSLKSDSSATHFVRHDASQDSTLLVANRAELVTVRGQGAD
jgi:hypothetical protein